RVLGADNLDAVVVVVRAGNLLDRAVMLVFGRAFLVLRSLGDGFGSRLDRLGNHVCVHGRGDGRRARFVGCLGSVLAFRGLRVARFVLGGNFRMRFAAFAFGDFISFSRGMLLMLFAVAFARRSRRVFFRTLGVQAMFVAIAATIAAA